jgi:hypothetical protein
MTLRESALSACLIVLLHLAVTRGVLLHLRPNRPGITSTFGVFFSIWFPQTALIFHRMSLNAPASWCTPSIANASSRCDLH